MTGFGDRRHARGAAAEELALGHLRARGLVLITRNYRCRRGEIDLVMQDGDETVFVEVRLRTPGGHASAAESIDARKRARVIAAARHYLGARVEMPCRFDCVVMERATPDAVQWLRAAFDAS